MHDTFLLIGIVAIIMAMVVVFYKFLIKRNIKDAKDVIKEKTSDKDASSFR